MLYPPTSSSLKLPCFGNRARPPCIQCNGEISTPVFNKRACRVCNTLWHSSAYRSNFFQNVSINRSFCDCISCGTKSVLPITSLTASRAANGRLIVATPWLTTILYVPIKVRLSLLHMVCSDALRRVSFSPLQPYTHQV